MRFLPRRFGAGALSTLETFLAPVEIPLLLGVLEFLPRVLMFAAGPPVAAARLGTGSPPPPGVGFLLRFFCGLPQPAAREIFHDGIRMLLLDALERRQQLLALGSAKRRGQAAGNDRPVHKARRHQ
jgi:hypothetical protein